MRRQRGSSSVAQKSREISGALLIYWVEAVWSGFLLFFYALSPLAITDPWTIFIAIFLAIYFIMSVTGIRDLKKFKVNFTNDPKTYKNKKFRHPILYQAVFWQLLKRD